MADWIETFKGAVLASEYDSQAHMNSQMYVSRFDQATWFLLQAVGVTPATMKQENRRIGIVRQNYQFLEELRGGELVVIRSGVLAIGDKHVRLLHQMFGLESRKMLATCDCTVVQVSLETGKSIPLPDSFKGGAEQHLVTANVEIVETD